MAIQKSEGIVLNRQDLRETSLILTFYTKDFGKIKGILRGVRGARVQGIGASLEIFAHDEVVFYERRRSDIYTVSQCDLLEFFGPVRESLDKLAYAAYMTELLDSVTALADKNIDVFYLLLNSLNLLSGEASPRRVTRIFEIKLLHLLGLMPGFESCMNCGCPAEPNARFSLRMGGLICKNCVASDTLSRPILPGTIRFIEHIMSSPFDRVSRIKVSEPVGRELEGILRRFLDYHIERRLKTLAFIRSVGN